MLHSNETFWFKTTAEKDGKTKMFHIFSPRFLPFFSEFSKCQNLKLFPSQVGGCLQAHWEGQGFLFQWILPLQKYVNQLHGFCVNRSMASAVWHTNAFILSGYKGIWCRVFFVATPERNATATQKELLWWDGFYSDSLKQTVDQLWEHCASWSYTCRGRKLIL